MNASQRTKLVVAAIVELRAEGCPVAKPDMGSIAIRRWFSSARRGVKQNDLDARVRDLAKGLIAQFEANPRLVGPLMRDYECVARRVARALIVEAGELNTENLTLRVGERSGNWINGPDWFGSRAGDVLISS